MYKKIILIVLFLTYYCLSQTVQTLWDDTTNIRGIRDTIKVIVYDTTKVFKTNDLMRVDSAFFLQGITTIRQWGVLTDNYGTMNYQVETDDTFEIMCKAPDPDTGINRFYRIYGGGAIYADKVMFVEILENVIPNQDWLDTAIVLPSGNNDREFYRESRLKCYASPIYTGGYRLFITAGGSIRANPTTSSAGFVVFQDFFKLNPQWYYLIRYIPREIGSGYVTYNFNWPEIKLDSAYITQKRIEFGY